MITIRAARTTDAVYIAEGIYEAFLLPSSDLAKDPTFHQRWLDTLTRVCAQADTHTIVTPTHGWQK